MTACDYRHESVLPHESVDAVLSDLSGCYVDATFGRGGHARLILEQLNDDARLIVIDKDPEAIAAANNLAKSDSRVTVCHSSFASISALLKDLEITHVTGVFADLGVSSPQLDDAQRGFSFQNDGPLDMRMDSSSGETAADWLARVTPADLATVLKKYGEERFAKRIANAIVEAGKVKKLESTLELAKLVSDANPAWEKNKHPATRTFQAIRIFINQELNDLEVFLEDAAKSLCLGGRLSVISFHSLEDRIVKRFMKSKSMGSEPPPGVPVLEKDIVRNYRLHAKAIKPSDNEVTQNVRARSAVLRSLEKVSYE